MSWGARRIRSPVARPSLGLPSVEARSPGAEGRTARWVASACGTLAALAAFTSSAPAQRGGPGFLFKPLTGSVIVRAGFDHANAGSDIFSFTTEQLTLSRGDFSGATFGADLSFRLAPRVDLMVGTSYAGRSRLSEFRHFVDQDNLPIQQTTTFQRVPVTAGLKLYILPRGQRIGHLAWVPARLTPYVGGGGGALWYRFRQKGDFVDADTREIFTDTFSSSGWTPEAHALAGLELSLSPRVALVTEGRYTWASARMSDDFANFDRIDLSGFSATVGLALRF
jgi:hypothetical protein